MHAVVVKVKINDSEAAESHLREKTTQRTQRIAPKTNCRQ